MYINTFKYKPEDVSCVLCTEYVKKLGCTALSCPCLAERTAIRRRSRRATLLSRRSSPTRRSGCSSTPCSSPVSGWTP